jgi:hypothetical protein
MTSAKEFGGVVHYLTMARQEAISPSRFIMVRQLPISILYLGRRLCPGSL